MFDRDGEFARAEDRLRRVERRLGRQAVAPLNVHGALQVNSHYQILYFDLDGGRDTFYTIGEGAENR